MQANKHFKPAVVYFDSRIPHCSVRCGIRIEFGQLFPKNGNGFILRGLISACGLRIQNPIPVFGLFLGRRGSARLWLSMVIAVGGLYLLCMKNGFGGIETSDWILLSCAVLFSFQIMTVDHFAPQVDGVRLSLLQFFVVAVESTAAALLFENPTLAEFGANWLPLAYCGVMSSGVAYTLQILGQRDVNPAIASLIMCLESVFSALGGWLLLHQSLSMREVFGCTLIFAAVVLAQLPVEDWLKCRSASRK